MKKLIAGLLLVFMQCIGLTGIVFAREQQQLSLDSKPLPVAISSWPVIEPRIGTSKFFEDKQVEDKKTNRFLLALDIPVSPFRNQADMKDIRSQPFSESLRPKKMNIGLRYSLLPSVVFYSQNAHAGLAGNMFVLRENGMIRDGFQTEGLLERSIWFILFGIEGFVLEDNAPFILGGEDYRLDFRRQSYGGNLWMGVKFGSFQRSFIVVRVGRGLAIGRGEEKYISSVLGDSVSVPLYFQGFDVDYQSAEGRILVSHFIPAIKVERNRYKKLDESNGLFGLKDESFENLKVEFRMELIPFLKHDMIRVIVQRIEYFGSWNGLLFKNYQPAWQAYLRLAFK